MYAAGSRIFPEIEQVRQSRRILGVCHPVEMQREEWGISPTRQEFAEDNLAVLGEIPKEINIIAKERPLANRIPGPLGDS